MVYVRVHMDVCMCVHVVERPEIDVECLLPSLPKLPLSSSSPSLKIGCLIDPEAHYLVRPAAQ